MQVLVLLTGAFSLYLYCLKVGMLDCVAMDVALPYQTALGRIVFGCFSPGFL
jgi:hypothetical protein